MVGFGQLAWLRGDHARAAELMGECLPALRRLGDQRCAGRALCILGERAHEQRQLARAEELLRGSVEAIVLAGQSIVLVSALEALAAVCCAQGRSRHAALLLGAAHTARKSASAHMRPARPPDEELRRSLARALGAAALGVPPTARASDCPRRRRCRPPPPTSAIVRGSLLHDSSSAPPERRCGAGAPCLHGTSRRRHGQGR